DPGPSDATLINAGATHLHPVWLDTLRLGGRLLVPLTAAEEANDPQWGRVLKVAHQPHGFFAHFISEVGIFPCSGARDLELNDKLNEAFKRGDWNRFSRSVGTQTMQRIPAGFTLKTFACQSWRYHWKHPFESKELQPCWESMTSS